MANGRSCSRTSQEADNGMGQWAWSMGQCVRCVRWCTFVIAWKTGKRRMNHRKRMDFKIKNLDVDIQIYNYQ